MESESLTVLYGPHSTGSTLEQQAAGDYKERNEKVLKDTHNTSNEADSETKHVNTCENIESESLTILVSPQSKGQRKDQQPAAGESIGKEPNTLSDYSSLNKNWFTDLPGNISSTGDKKRPEAYVLSGVAHPYVTLDEKGTSKPVTFVRQMSCPEDSQLRGLYTAVVIDPGQLKPKKQSASPSPERDTSSPIGDTDKMNRCLSFAVCDLKAKHENNTDSDNEYADAMESHSADRNSEREESPSDSDTSNFSWQREYIALLEEYNEFQIDMAEKQENLKAKLANAEAKIMEIASVYKEEKRLKVELKESKEHIKRLQDAVFELENKDRTIQRLADELSMAHGQIDSLHCKVKQLEDSANNKYFENTVFRTEVSTQTEEEKAREVFSNALYQDVPMDMFDVDLRTRFNDLKKSIGDLQKTKDDIVQINDKTELQLETCKDENRQWQTLSELLQTISEAKDDVDSNRTRSEPTYSREYFTIDDDLKKDNGSSCSYDNVAHAETLKSKKSEMCSPGDFDKGKHGYKEKDSHRSTSISPSRDVTETEDDSVFLSDGECKTNIENLGFTSTTDTAKDTLRAERLKEKVVKNETPMRLESKVFESVEDTLEKDSVQMRHGNEVMTPVDTIGVTKRETDKVIQDNNNEVIQENVKSTTKKTTQTVIQEKTEEKNKGVHEVPKWKIKEINPGKNAESGQVKPAMGQSYEAKIAEAVDGDKKGLVRATADKRDKEPRTPAKKDGSVQNEHGVKKHDSGVDDELRIDSSSDEDTHGISREGSSQNTQKKKAHRISDEYWVEYV